MNKLLLVLLLVIPSGHLLVQELPENVLELFEKYKQERMQNDGSIGIDFVIEYNNSINLYKFLYHDNYNFYKINISSLNYDNAEWEKKAVCTFDYFETELLKMKSYETWNGSDWKKNHRNLYEYDANGNLITDISQKGDDDNKWVHNYMKQYSHLDDKISLTEIYSRSNNSWKLYRKEHKDYDSSGNLIEDRHVRLENNQWNNVYKAAYIFNNQNQLISYIQYDWDGSDWIVGIESTISYYEDGKRMSYVSSGESQAQYFYEYYEDRNLKSEKYRNMDETSLKDMSLTTFTYNTQNLIDTIYLLIYPTDMMPYTSELRTIYSYNENQNMESCRSYYKEDSLWKEGGNILNPEILRVNDKYGNTQGFFGEKVFYHWDVISSVNESIAGESNFEIYPNPATDYIEIKNLSLTLPAGEDGIRVEIIDMLGRSVERNTPSSLRESTPLLEGNNRINISNLQPGIYFVRIGDEFLKFVKI